ncbi:MAG: phytanoyl-CoA dioxygenase family protein [Lautropia sp.]
MADARTAPAATDPRVRTPGSGSLTADQIAAYRAEGFCFPFTAMSTQAAQAYCDRLEQFERQHGQRASQILRQKSHLVLTFIDEIIRLDAILDAVQSLIGPDILCWSTSFFIKNPGDGRFISWHQDASYWGLEADDIVTAWIALSDSHLANGCMKIARRTHLALLPHNDRPEAGNMLTRGQEVAATVDERDVVPIELARGQFSLHHHQIVHGSGPNLGSTRRIGLAIRYVRPTARQVVDAHDTAMLVRGVDRHGHFQAEPRPRCDMDPAGIEFLEAALAVRAGGVFRRVRA